MIDILDAGDMNFQPNTNFLLTILASLLVSTVTIKRSFSKLKRLKTLLRVKLEMNLNETFN